MDEIIQIATKISALDAAIASVRLENNQSSRLVHLNGDRQALVKKLHTLTGRVYHKDARWIAQ